MSVQSWRIVAGVLTETGIVTVTGTWIAVPLAIAIAFGIDGGLGILVGECLFEFGACGGVMRGGGLRGGLLGRSSGRMLGGLLRWFCLLVRS